MGTSRRNALLALAAAVAFLAMALGFEVRDRETRSLRSEVAVRSEVATPTRPVVPTGRSPGRDNVADEFHRRVNSLEERLDRDPADADALLELARTLQAAHQPAAASTYYHRYLDLEPDDRGAWLDLAVTLAALGRWDEAERATRATLARWPDDPEAMYNLGAIHANRGEVEAARHWWGRVAQGSNAELRTRAGKSIRALSPEGS